MKDRTLPSLKLEKEKVGGEVKAYVSRVQERCLELNESNETPSDVILYRTAAIDQLMVSLYRRAEEITREKSGLPSRFCLVSQGGYGRRELCHASDIDLLFLYEGRSHALVKIMTEQILQPLWDAGLEIGFATRTLKDCWELADGDLTILTALIDARWLAGSDPLFQEFTKGFVRYFQSEKKRNKFFQEKLAENDERHRRYGEASFLAEPNLKEGKGGLRDYHTILWLARVIHRIDHPEELSAKGILSPASFQDLWEALSFLWKVRNELHYLSKRKNDHLLLDYQEKISGRLGYRNNPHFLGVELFMQRYHQMTATISQIADRFHAGLIPDRPKLFPKLVTLPEDPYLAVRGDWLTVTHSDVFEKNPLYLLKVFDSARRAGKELDSFTLDRIREALPLVDERYRRDPSAGALFRELLKNPKGLHKMLVKMHEVRLLGAFLPEFAKLLFRVQHDAYHVYSVDTHSLYAVGEAEKLATGEVGPLYGTPREVIKDVSNFDLLVFAILYHDIGKGEGSGHVEKGAPLIRQAGERGGFGPDEVDLLEFLERSHLIMTHLAFRRDLEEQNLIVQFAKSMQTMERLNLLYLLTFCDVKGVSPEAMTDWKGSLLEYLYLRTREVLQKGDFTTERASALLPGLWEKVKGLTATPEGEKRAENFFQMMSPRYLLTTPPSDIHYHMQLWERFDRDPIVVDWRVLEKERLNEISLFTLNHPGLFSKTTGVLAVHRINILDAELALSRRGHALLMFRVTDAGGEIIDDEIRWKRFEKDLREVLQGKMPMAAFVKEGFRPSLLEKKPVRRLPTRIEVDNDVSAFYTVIDVYAHDRVGLLYQITSALESLGLYVEISKISTKVDQVSDVFYVKDIFGHKILSREKIQHITKVLKEVIDEL